MLCFFASLGSGKVEDLGWNPEVHLSYAEPWSTKFVSINGTGEIVQDRAKEPGIVE
jgi:general stress protein 26